MIIKILLKIQCFFDLQGSFKLKVQQEARANVTKTSFFFGTKPSLYKEQFLNRKPEMTHWNTVFKAGRSGSLIVRKAIISS